MTTKQYISLHLNDDVRELALRPGDTSGVDLRFALTQIEGRQKARRKLPEWAANDDITYPPHLSMEQCSSEVTAKMKANLVRETIKKGGIEGELTLVDLTGGFGVDFACMARAFTRAVYVERNSQLCDIARHNFKALGLSNAEVVCAEAEDYLDRMEHATCIFADPARRDAHGQRTYSVRDCTPDVLAMKDKLLTKSDFVMLKLSPMLDIKQTVRDFGRCVCGVTINEVGGECKELLLELSASESTSYTTSLCVDSPMPVISYTCLHEGATPADDNNVADAHGSKATADEIKERNTLNKSLLTAFLEGPETQKNNDSGKAGRQGKRSQEASTDCQTVAVKGENGQVSPRELYIIEPPAAVMKAGCFEQIEREFGFTQISKNSHLFLSTGVNRLHGWRTFRITAVTTMNKRQLKTFLCGVSQANITVRNFPMTTAVLRNKLKLKDGGDVYIFATTLEDGTHVLIKGVRA